MQQPSATPLIPQAREHELQQRQIAGRIASIIEDAFDQARLETQPHFFGRGSDRPLEFCAGHRSHIDLRALQPIGERAIPERAPDEVAAQGEHDGERAVCRGVQKLVDETAPDRIVSGEGVELFPLVGDQQQAVGAGLLVERALHDVAQGNPSFSQVTSQLGDLGKPFRLGHLWLEQRQQRRCQSVQGPVARHQCRPRRLRARAATRD